MNPSYKTGETVTAFHPRMFGVVKEGRIVKVGHKYLHIDFGLWGTERVLPQYVTGHTLDWRN
jgi:hypothetical protein